MGELSKKVGRRIKIIREAKGIKQCALAAKLNMEPSNLTRIENGYQLPKEENLEKISQILEVEVKDLFDFAPTKDKGSMINKIYWSLGNLSHEKVEFVYNFINLYILTHKE